MIYSCEIYVCTRVYIKLLVRVRNVLCQVNNSMIFFDINLLTKAVFCLYDNTNFISRSLKLLNESVKFVCLKV